ncbi:MAG: SUMF1/EgtB/PvdO family nonheme iron enzyme [Verrucomicrobiaceae bacterium]|nr:SUMF1/EgtB/PvdO family nonheme iron enzyme [Verrucomicrobiaceae bacterium]
MHNAEAEPQTTLTAANGVQGSVASSTGLLRQHVHIPDYRLIKRIGSGAYGEVWLAESVTGALRAVKIVWREDFELTKTFHREFQGIQQFEPISRGHPGLVHILHVGWNDEGGYYYCVMELADDVGHGPHVDDPLEYVPRTLGTDLRQHGRLDLHFCQEAGSFLADALHYMHNHGLTHRDIKPSNIIYCGGVCKLADIGLVAGFGERSFVGTEGFVPPEGPGTPQADIYSLGKVVYEMTSGKDRMEFPEVPDNLDETEMPFWKNLNQVICRACAPDLSERFQTAGEFAEALRSVTETRPLTLVAKLTTWVSRAAMFTFGSLICGAAIASYRTDHEWRVAFTAATSPPAMALYPTPGQPWRGTDGQWFTFKKVEHVADALLNLAQFNRFLEAEMRSFEGEIVPITVGKRQQYVVIIPAQDADDYCSWITALERKNKRLPLNLEYSWLPVTVQRPSGSPPLKPGWAAVECRVKEASYGSLIVQSTPSPAQVYEGDTPLGQTPLTLPRVRAGKFEFEVRYPGYKPELIKGDLKKGTSLTLPVKLKNIRAVIFGKPWTNTLGMKFVPLGKAMIGAHEVRRRDFREFVRVTKLTPLPDWKLENESELDLPIASVTRAEAISFSAWLTSHEQSQEILDGSHQYKLPTDDEWSMAAYLPREKGDAPADKHLRGFGVYPWGYIWPPPPFSGNLLDQSAPVIAGRPALADYKDGFPAASPVEGIKADPRGIFGLSGNVWEWVAEDYGGEDPVQAVKGTARGGGFRSADRAELQSGFRRALSPDGREDDVGFRLMLSDGRPARTEE